MNAKGSHNLGGSQIHLIVKEKHFPTPITLYLQDIIDSFNIQSSPAWREQVINQNDSYHRKVLLQQGRADFDKPPHGLSGEELLLLYNYYYMPMHLSSSYMLYRKLFTSKEGMHLYQNKNPVFLDWGCGTFASSIAFSSLIREHNRVPKKIRNTTYYGIDISENMLRYCLSLAEKKFVWQEEANNSLDKLLWHYIIAVHPISIPFTYETVLQDSFIFYKDIFPDEDFLLALSEQRKKGIQESFKDYDVDTSTIEDEFTLILNFSYLFASHSLSPLDLAVAVNRMLHKYEKLNVFAVFQNPTPGFLNTKWEDFKTMVPMKTIMNGQSSIPYFTYSTLKYEVLHKPSGEVYKSASALRMIVNSTDKDTMIKRFREVIQEASNMTEKEFLVGYGMNENYQPPPGMTDDDMIEIIIEAANVDGRITIPPNFQFSQNYVALFKIKGITVNPINSK